MNVFCPSAMYEVLRVSTMQPVFVMTKNALFLSVKMDFLRKLAVGPNGIDEDGRDRSDAPRGDDIRRRVPLR